MATDDERTAALKQAEAELKAEDERRAAADKKSRLASAVHILKAIKRQRFWWPGD